jgi:hypothetical protein
MVTQSGSLNWVHRDITLLLTAALLLIPFTSAARASNLDEAPLDAATLLQMEQRAETAQPRDQCYLFAEVLHGLTELAGRQMAAGDDIQAAATFTQIDSVAQKMEKASAANAKRLKNAEMILEHITRRLTDMVHVASTDDRNATQTALKNIDHLHTQVLAVLFSK